MRNFLLLLSLFAFSCTSQTGIAQGKLDPGAFEKGMAQEGAQIVDVRTPQEFGSGHLNGAVNLDISAPGFAENIARLDKNKPVYVYCAVGGRSASAAGYLLQQGFTKVYDLSGGISAWQRAGKKVVK
ncbi:MAG: rhodanese-like domain-containing protein [Saprospiraceae bacterium]|nr:rhodanese-like domain-containing protein [Saprospiraceae bacterium]